MAVDLRGFTPITYKSDGAQTVLWPAAAGGGDYVVMVMMERESGSPNATVESPYYLRLRPTLPGYPEDASPTRFMEVPYVKFQLLASSATVAIYGGMLSKTPPALLGVTTKGAYLAGMIVLSGCRGVGKVTSQAGATTTEPDGGILVVDRGNTAGTVQPTTDKIFTDVANPKNNNRKLNAWFQPAPTVGHKTLTGTNGSRFTSFELLPAAVPAAPTLLTPAPGAHVDYGADLPITWTHNSDVEQEAVRVQVKVSGAWTRYLTSSGTLTTTATNLLQNEGGATIAAAALTNNTDYAVRVATSSDGTLYSAWSEERQFRTATPPAVTGVTVTSPAEHVTPVVSWAETLGTAAQIAFQVRICPAADAAPDNPMYSSGVQPGAALTWSVPAQDWTNGASLKAWVRISQTGGQWSPWVPSSPFSVSWTPPPAPTGITILATGLLQATIAGLGGRDSVHLQSSPDHTSWTDILHSPVTDASLTIRLPQAPYGQPLYLRARTADTIADGNVVWSAWTETVTVSWDTAAYLISLDGLSWLRVDIYRDEPQQMVQFISVTYGHEADQARTDYGPEQGLTGTTTLRTSGPEDAVALYEFWRRHETFRLRWPPERVAGTLVDGGQTVMSRITPRRTERLAQVLLARRLHPFSWVERK